MTIRRFYKNMRMSISQTDTRSLSNALWIFGFLAMAISFIINEPLYQNSLIDVILIFLMFFFWGTAGLIYIIRKEVPVGFWNVKGVLAIITGVVVLLSSWGLAIVLIARYILGYLN